MIECNCIPLHLKAGANVKFIRTLWYYDILHIDRKATEINCSEDLQLSYERVKELFERPLHSQMTIRNHAL